MLKRIAAILFLTVSASGLARAEATRPADPSLVLAEVPNDAVTSGPLAAMSTALAADPNNLELAVTLARTAIERGRAAADPRYYGRAEAALAPWWTLARPPTEVRILRATIRQAYHQFDQAAADLAAVIAEDPANAQASFSLAFIELTRGRPAEATHACARIADQRLKLVRAICAARVAAMTGRGGEAAVDLMKSVARERRSNLAMTRFALSVLADIKTGTGDWAAATRYYQQSMAAGQADAATIAAYADILLALNKPREALLALEGQGSADIIILRQAIAARRLGDPRAMAWRAILEDRFAANAASGNRVHLREEARFLLDVKDDARAALTLAGENFKVQREPADAELLLRAAIAAKQVLAAGPVLDHVQATGLKDQRLEPLIARLSAIGGQS